MSSGLRRATAAILLAGASATLLLGCDNDQNKADKQVKRELAQARQAAYSDANGSEAAQKQFEIAATDAAAASPGIRATAKAALAQAELDAAYTTIRKIDRAELDLSRLVWEISQLSDQIQTSTSTIAGYRTYDPKPARDAIAAKIAEAQGGPGKSAWFTHGKTTIPTLSAVKQDIARIEGEISQRQDQLKSLNDQRAKLLDDAEKSAAQADQLKGDKAVEVFKRSSDLRCQAGDKAVEIDRLGSQVARLQRELTIAQGQESTLNEVITQFQDQAAALDAGWKDIAAQVARQQQLSAQVLGGPVSTAAPATEPADSTAGASIAAKAVRLEQLVQEIQKLRDDAGNNARNAATHFDDAYKAADELRRNLQADIDNPKNSGRPEIAAWRTAQSVMDPMQFRLQEAAAQRTLGGLYASEASSLARRMVLRDSLEAALKDSDLRVPREILDGDMNKARQTAVDLADAAYKESDSLLNDITEGRNEDIKPIAHLARALTLFGWSELARLQNNQQAINDRIAQATQERNLAAERNLPLPALPVELGQPPKPAAENPAPAETASPAAPTTAPAQAPQ